MCVRGVEQLDTWRRPNTARRTDLQGVERQVAEEIVVEVEEVTQDSVRRVRKKIKSKDSPRR